MNGALELAKRFGLRRSGRSYLGACPSCGVARAFSVRDWRNHVEARCFYGCSREVVWEAIQRAVGSGWQSPNSQKADNTAAKECAIANALKVWCASIAAPNTLADTYLIRRGLPGLVASPALRFRGDCKHPGGARLPAMVAVVVDIIGTPMAVHRTYLAANGQKTSIEPQKASKGPVWGGAIRLDPEASEIVIGEGIETSASAGRLLQLPAWAAISAGNLGSGLALPSQVRAVVIAADADAPGERAAQAAMARWRDEGRRVRIVRPDRAGEDFNDILRNRVEAQHAA